MVGSLRNILQSLLNIHYTQTCRTMAGHNNVPWFGTFMLPDFNTNKLFMA